MSDNRPYCISIAGFDPSGGAGVLADIKTFEAHKVQGFGVATAITYQNDQRFNGLRWISTSEIEAQLAPLKKFPVEVAKIGLVENMKMLEFIIVQLMMLNPNMYIIWDPVLKASSGFDFQNLSDRLISFIGSINLITPNQMEYNELQHILEQSPCDVLLKGGHRNDLPGSDTLITDIGEVVIAGKPFENKIDKHGTGCVLSSAIAANLSLGMELKEACNLAKKYVEKFIQSNETNLGYHSL